MQARMSNSAMSGPDTAPCSRRRILAYWVLSAPVLMETMVGAGWDLARIPYVQEVMGHLSYPLYVLTILGVAKGLAVRQPCPLKTTLRNLAPHLVDQQPS